MATKKEGKVNVKATLELLGRQYLVIFMSIVFPVIRDFWCLSTFCPYKQKSNKYMYVCGVRMTTATRTHKSRPFQNVQFKTAPTCREDEGLYAGFQSYFCDLSKG